MQVQGGDEHKGEVWTDILGWSQEEVTIEEDGAFLFSSLSSLCFSPFLFLRPALADADVLRSTGWATFKAPSKSVSIWAKKDARGRDSF
jgi:alpha-amylase